MKDEIKEILDILKDVSECKEGSRNGLMKLCYTKYKLLLDYITNLQTIEQQYSAILSENAELENKLTNLQEDNERLSVDNKTLKRWYQLCKSRNEKAIEYLKDNACYTDNNDFVDDLSYDCCKELLNILNGDDKE